MCYLSVPDCKIHITFPRIQYLYHLQLPVFQNVLLIAYHLDCLLLHCSVSCDVSKLHGPAPLSSLSNIILLFRLFSAPTNQQTVNSERSLVRPKLCPSLNQPISKYIYTYIHAPSPNITSDVNKRETGNWRNAGKSLTIKETYNDYFEQLFSKTPRRMQFRRMISGSVCRQGCRTTFTWTRFFMRRSSSSHVRK